MKKLLVSLLATVAAIFAAPAFATYTPQSYAGVSEALTAEIGAAITTGLPLFGLVLGVFIAIKLIRRLAKG
jgi:hypothetical protein